MWEAGGSKDLLVLCTHMLLLLLLLLCMCVCVCAIVFVGQTVASMTSISERVVEDFLLDHGKADVILLCDSYDQVCAAKGIERLRECV